MTRLLDEHARHGAMPHHVLEKIGRGLGVAPESVKTRYAVYLGGLAAASRWRLDSQSIAVIMPAADFLNAAERLRAEGETPVFALVERAIWRDVSRPLVGLRVAERRRRQALAEGDPCGLCTASPALAVAA